MRDSVHIFVRPADQLSADERQQVIDLCTHAYDEDFAAIFVHHPGSTHVIAQVNGQFVSHACWVVRGLQPAGLPILRTAYVEAVATHPDFHRRGIATQTMQALHTAIYGFDLGGLSPNPGVAHWYQRLGWEDWQGPLALRTDDGLRATPGERVMILRLPATPHLDLTAQLSAEWRTDVLW